MKRECRNCDYFAIDPETPQRGSCRIVRPKLQIVPLPQGQITFQSIFPLVELDWWCGEFKQATEDEGGS